MLITHPVKYCSEKYERVNLKLVTANTKLNFVEVFERVVSSMHISVFRNHVLLLLKNSLIYLSKGMKNLPR